MRTRTIRVRITDRFDQYDDVVRDLAREVGARFQGAGPGNGLRYYYLIATDEQLSRIVEGLRRAGASVASAE